MNTIPKASVLLLALALSSLISCTAPSNPQAEADLIRTTERERLRSLVAADMNVARALHSDDFQLINPLGETFSKEQYLGGVASGEFDYLLWEPKAIEVRVHGEEAVIRYESQLEIVVRGQMSQRADTGTRTLMRSATANGK